VAGVGLRAINAHIERFYRQRAVPSNPTRNRSSITFKQGEGDINVELTDFGATLTRVATTYRRC
jgi:hypothetical protein